MGAAEPMANTRFVGIEKIQSRGELPLGKALLSRATPGILTTVSHSPQKESVVAITLAKTLRLLAAEKRAVLQRQTALVANLNKLLPSIGYRVVPLEDDGRADARSSLRGGRRSTALGARPFLNKPLVCRYCQRT